MGIELLIALGLGGYSYMQSRKFVREKLRFVDAAHKPGTAVVAGVAAGVAVGVVAAIPFVPFVGGATAVLAGCGVGFGVSKGSKDTRRLTA
ncbi:MAG: hypothetical protein OEY63_06345 [Gemmatimonadota bacterium]|nr:hypothetical protein [Gemmatimonadota bacterium]MDH5805700.1 hypothetical protein [Gemmatimonadota bacterium]